MRRLTFARPDAMGKQHNGHATPTARPAGKTSAGSSLIDRRRLVSIGRLLCGRAGCLFSRMTQQEAHDGVAPAIANAREFERPAGNSEAEKWPAKVAGQAVRAGERARTSCVEALIMLRNFRAFVSGRQEASCARPPLVSDARLCGARALSKPIGGRNRADRVWDEEAGRRLMRRTNKLALDLGAPRHAGGRREQ